MIQYLLPLLFVGNAWAAGFEPPAYQRPVMDQAGLLSSEVAEQMSLGLDSLYRGGGSQIGVLTVDTLNGDTIESAGIKTAEKWKLGTAKGDNGVILLISKGDRSLRIEVGQGREGALTDLYAKRIIEDVIVPRFKSGNFEQGIIEGVVTIMKYTDPDKNLSTLAGRAFPSGQVRNRGATDWSSMSWLMILFTILFKHPLVFFFVVLFLIRLLGGHKLRGRSYHSGWGGGGFGGGFGGGGFGGGGFSGGGGGGFSGGGASGRW